MYLLGEMVSNGLNPVLSLGTLLLGGFAKQVNR